MSTTLRSPYRRDFMDWLPASGLRVQVVEKPRRPIPSDPEASIEEALRHPLDSEPLEDLARRALTATIVVTDATRPCPDQRLVSALLRRLQSGGLRDEAIRIVVAIGMHRPSTDAEKIEKLGKEIVSRFAVHDSEPLEPAMQVDLGVTPDGTPVRIDRRVVETDLLISTGIIEPHQYAGFSGGWKTVGIGTAASATITRLHGMRFLEDPAVRLANTEGNPFLEEMRWIGERAGLRFVMNVSLNPEGSVDLVRAGHPESVHRDLSAIVKEQSVVPIEREWPIVIGGAGHPKDSNLYQATRMPTYLCFGRRPAVARGGAILVPAACPEGAGAGPGEKLFFDWLSSGSPDEILSRARTEGYPAGGQRAVMVAWARMIADIAFIGTACPGIVEACGMKAFPTLAEGVTWARGKTGSSDVLVVPRCLTTLPEVRD